MQIKGGRGGMMPILDQYLNIPIAILEYSSGLFDAKTINNQIFSLPFKEYPLELFDAKLKEVEEG